MIRLASVGVVNRLSSDYPACFEFVSFGSTIDVEVLFFLFLTDFLGQLVELVLGVFIYLLTIAI